MLSMIPWIRFTSPSASTPSRSTGIWLRPGILPMSSLTDPIFFIWVICWRKSLRSNFPLASSLLLALRFFLVDGRLGRLDQADDVAHAEHLADDPFGVERLELVELFALADELDRHARDLPHRQRRAAAGIAVELGHDHAVEFERLVEGAGEATASWPVSASQTKNTWCGLTFFSICLSSAISSSSM